MLSINTNLSSLITQSSMKQSTAKLDLAVERLSTGYKINHSKDNAANYSISTNMDTKLGAYQVAEDNVSMGLDLVATANDIISQMQGHGQRIRDLIIKAQNGTYSGNSLTAIDSEIEARITEINRLYVMSEYNKVSLLEYTLPFPSWVEDVKSGSSSEKAGLTEDITPKYNGFIEEAHTVDDAVVNALPHVADVSEFQSGKTYAVSSVEDLVNLAALVNAGKSTQGVTFSMGADIDLKEYCENHIDTGGWIPIGNYSADSTLIFRGTFDGNGHKISNLKIDRELVDYQGLFGYVPMNYSIINVAIENAEVIGQNQVGALCGFGGSTRNCYSTGKIIASGNYVGGLVGHSASAVTNCYAITNVSGKNYVGGLYGRTNGNPLNCFSKGVVKGDTHVGGLVGESFRSSTNCYSESDVYGKTQVGGLYGSASLQGLLKNCYSIGDVFATGDYVGGLVGYSVGSMYNSYSTGNVSSEGNYLGGLVGCISGAELKNCYSTGDVVAISDAQKCISGLVGYLYKPSDVIDIDKVFTTSSVMTESEFTGALIGGIVNTSNLTTYGEINITNMCSLKNNSDLIGGVYRGSPAVTNKIDYDMTDWLTNINEVERQKTTLQVGIGSNDSNQIVFDCAFEYDLSSILTLGAKDKSSLDVIDEFLGTLSEKSTQLGSVGNRLESVLDEIAIQYDNLVSSRSTIRDADVAEVSASYIQQQILQQAAATLMSTANQSPAIALQLI